jgi:DHA1 family bicyclomycin/chloramphenicol resistance-like MFS transporter
MTGDAERRAPISATATLALGLLAATAPLSLDAYLPALPAMAAEFDVSAQAVQLSLTACLLGLGAGQLLAGPIGDRYGRRIPMIVGATLYFGASLGCAFAPSAGALIALRLVQGLSGAVGIVLSRAMVRDVAVGRLAARLYSQMAAVAGAAPVIAPVAGAVVIASFGWRAVFLLLAVLGVGMIAAVVFVLGETHPRHRRTSAALGPVLRSFRGLAGDPLFRGYLVIALCSSALLFSYISSAPFVLQGTFGFTEIEFAGAFACVGIGLIATSLTTARLLRRHEATAVVRVAIIVQIVGVALVGLVVFAQLALDWSHPAVLIACLVVAVVPCGAIGPSCTSLAMARSAERAGSASALLGTSMFLAGALVSPISGTGNPATIMVALMLASALAALVVSTAMARRRRDGAADDE